MAWSGRCWARPDAGPPFSPRLRCSGRRRPDGRGGRHRAGSSSSAGISRPRPVRRPRRCPALPAAGTPRPALGSAVSVQRRGDAEVVEGDRLQRRQHRGILDMHHRRRLPARRRSPSRCAPPPAPPVTTRRARRTCSHFAASASSRQSAGVSGKSCRWTEASSPGKPLQPDLLHGEHQDRRQPGGQAVEQQVQHRARGAAAGGVAVAVERVLADVEVERREVGGGEVEQRAEHALEVVFRIALADRLRRVRPAGAAPSAPVPASRTARPRSASVKPARLPSRKRMVLRRRR